MTLNRDNISDRLAAVGYIAIATSHRIVADGFP
jgi:hypothetical protein